MKTGIETVACGYAVFYLTVACTYRRPGIRDSTTRSKRYYPNVAIAYLCCDDLDRAALSNISAVCEKYQSLLIVHDDSGSEENRARVDRLVGDIANQHAHPIRLLRRSVKNGGKPGAVNHIVGQLLPDIEFLLICDSDSHLPNSDFLEDALSHFQAPDVALVQFHNRGHLYKGDRHGYRTLSASIDFYDAFVYFMDRFGWSPFLGHNAVLSISAFKAVGGFTPGQLADDIDYSVKLRLEGYAIRYARTVYSGERHPASYMALRRRTRKWAYGCTQILMRWSWPVFKSNRLTLLDKLSFFLTVGYYHFQILLLGYLFIFYICLPFQAEKMGGAFNLLVSAGMILTFTFLPSLIYFAVNRCMSAWPVHVLYWGFTYGSQDFVMVRAFFKCIFGRPLGWMPTNGSAENEAMVDYLPELAFGSLIIVIAAIHHPILLALPTTGLFAGKFLCAPFLNRMVFRHSPGGASGRTGVPFEGTNQSMRRSSR